MKLIGSALVALILFGSSWLAAAEPVDSQVKSALYDIEKYENQFSAQSTANASTVKRTLKLLTLTRQRLDSSDNKSHPSWLDADARYKRLVTHLNQLLNPSQTSSSPAASTTTSTTPSSAPAKQSNTASAASSIDGQQMISQQRVRIKKIMRDIQSRIQTMDQVGVKPFQSPEYVEKFETSAANFKQSLAKYDAFKSDSDVVAATQELQKMFNLISFGKNHAAKELAELGDVQKRLAQIETQMRQLSQAPTPQTPFKEGQLNQWLVQLAQTRQAAAEIYKPLPDIKQRAYLPNNTAVVQQGGLYDLNDIDRLERSLLDLVNSIDASLAQFGTELERVAQRTIEGLSHYSEYDPAKSFDQTNHFLSEGRADEVRAQLSVDKTNMKEAVQYATLLKKPSLSLYSSALEKVQATLTQYEANYQKARELIRMPEPASKDSKLLSIAKDTLKNYDYVAEIERMVVNAEKQHRTAETSDEKFDDIDVSLSGTITLSGTKTTYFYEWEQFQVATAEPVGSKFYIFYNTLKYYTSGDSTTPLNKWILSNRIQGPEIPKANISK